MLGESIGDLAGLKIAYLAFLKSQQGKPAKPPIDGFTQGQQFFIAWGQVRGDETRMETQKLMVQGRIRWRSRAPWVRPPTSSLSAGIPVHAGRADGASAGLIAAWCGSACLVFRALPAADHAKSY
ncbi:hypothetical protein SBA3_3540013 [Candidatus Sulfopaludibacter sp. SbA3]|nr:hypothetical protein SBA3_3540013 [Candidatus Sulfopaludibacter sp. SbA3]